MIITQVSYRTNGPLVLIQEEILSVSVENSALSIGKLHLGDVSWNNVFRDIDLLSDLAVYCGHKARTGSMVDYC